MTDAVHLVLDQDIDIALEQGFGIITERHAILTRLATGSVDAGECQSLTRRFHDLEIQWCLLTASYATAH